MANRRYGDKNSWPRANPSSGRLMHWKAQHPIVRIPCNPGVCVENRGFSAAPPLSHARMVCDRPLLRVDPWPDPAMTPAGKFAGVPAYQLDGHATAETWADLTNAADHAGALLVDFAPDAGSQAVWLTGPAFAGPRRPCHSPRRRGSPRTSRDDSRPRQRPRRGHAQPPALPPGHCAP
jgi:hypothetical protein